jgi:prevent-host-death family protein
MYDSYMTYDDGSGGPEHRISEAREQFATIINQVAYGGDRVRLTRHGKAVAAVVPIEDVDFLEDLEDELDLELVREALADPENQTPVPWEEVKRDLGL